MAWSNLGASGTAASSTSSSTLNLTLPAAIGVGNVGLLRVVSDNISTADGDTNNHTSISGWTGTVTKLGERTNTVGGAAGDGVCVSLWLLEASAIIAVNTVLTINFSASVGDKSAAFQRFSKGAGTTARVIGAVATGGADASNNPGALALAGLDSSSRLYIRAVGVEGNSTTTLTASTGFTALASVRSRNNASAVYAAGEFRINTSVGETSAPTLPTTSDNASVFAAIQEYADATLPLGFTGDTLPSGVHAYQAGPATRLNGSGVIVSATGARFDHLINGAYSAGTSALLVEPAATNVAQWSEDFTQTAWQKLGSSITSNAATAPDGNTTMDLIVEDGTNARHGIYQNRTLSAGQASVSAYMVGGAGRGYGFVTIEDSSGKRYAVVVDLTNGSVASTFSSGSPTGTGSLVEALPGGIYRIHVAMDAASGGVGIYAGPSNVGSPTWLVQCPQYTGNGTSGVYAWGLQIATAPLGSSYIPTTSASVTRSADSVQFTIPSGNSSLLVTFDDGTTQVLSVSPGSYTVPTNLTRARIAGIAQGSVNVDAGIATEVDVTLALAGVLVRAVGPGSETDAAFALPPIMARNVGLASESASALALAAIQIRAAGLAAETDSALALTRGGTAIAAGLAAETDMALALVPVPVLVRATGMATETDDGFALGRVVIWPAGLATGTDAALPLGAISIRAAGLAGETNIALALAAFSGLATGAATQTDTALALRPAILRSAGLASETDTAHAMASMLVLPAGLAVETDAAQVLDRVLLRVAGLVVETDSAAALSPAHALPTLAADETDEALALSPGWLAVSAGMAETTELA